MSVDHDRLDEIFEEFKKLKKIDLEGARPFFLAFKAGLQKHILWEENILFPIFEQETGMRDTGPTAVMRMEHRQIETFLEEIGEKVLAGELEGVDEAETGLLEVLGSHNQKEENILYPAIDNLTSEQEKEKAIENMTEGSSETLD
jgi:iron-sulfur cluster repair protein YtfE (RIC family)